VLNTQFGDNLRGKKTENLAGKCFGKWTVLKRDNEYKCNDYNAYWLCRCECGLEKPVNGSHLRLGKSLSCRKCSEQKNKNRVPSRMFSRIKQCKKFDVCLGNTNDEIKKFLYNLFEKQKGLCALSGFPIVFANTIKGDMYGETTASLDRIDSLKGYTKDNVQWVHKWINFMKQDFKQEDFINFCVAVAKHKGNYNA